MDSIDHKISIIMRQTNYSREVALEKLQVFEFNEINVIKDYIGIKEKPTTKVTSVNQEIYKQIRNRLNTAMIDYNNRVSTQDNNKQSP
jgi:hypothetical protein